MYATYRHEFESRADWDIGEGVAPLATGHRMSLRGIAGRGQDSGHTQQLS